MFDVTLKILIAYLLGALLGSLIIGKLRGGVDIRKLGSGNAGGTNALRTQGIWFALGVMIIDIGKGWLAAAVLPFIPLVEPTSSSEWLPLACATAAVIGHVFPIWFGFRGGKGAATLIGVVIGINPLGAAVAMIVWFCVLLLSGYVGLATMVATVSFPIYALFVAKSPSLLMFGLAMTLFVIYTHRDNIARMRRGVEHRSQRLWLLRPR